MHVAPAINYADAPGSLNNFGRIAERAELLLNAHERLISGYMSPPEVLKAIKSLGEEGSSSITDRAATIAPDEARPRWPMP